MIKYTEDIIKENKNFIKEENRIIRKSRLKDPKKIFSVLVKGLSFSVSFFVFAGVCMCGVLLLILSNGSMKEYWNIYLFWPVILIIFCIYIFIKLKVASFGFISSVLFIFFILFGISMVSLETFSFSSRYCGINHSASVYTNEYGDTYRSGIGNTPGNILECNNTLLKSERSVDTTKFIFWQTGLIYNFDPLRLNEFRDYDFMDDVENFFSVGLMFFLEIIIKSLPGIAFLFLLDIFFCFKDGETIYEKIAANI